jgi:hypothetical protein
MSFMITGDFSSLPCCLIILALLKKILRNYLHKMKRCQGLYPSCPPLLLRVLFMLQSKLVARKSARGGLRGKSIGGERILTGNPPWLPQNGAGRSGARGRAPLHRKTPVIAERTACLPGPRNDLCSWFFRATPFLRATSQLFSRKGTRKSGGASFILLKRIARRPS